MISYFPAFYSCVFITSLVVHFKLFLLKISFLNVYVCVCVWIEWCLLYCNHLFLHIPPPKTFYQCCCCLSSHFYNVLCGRMHTQWMLTASHDILKFVLFVFVLWYCSRCYTAQKLSKGSETVAVLECLAEIEQSVYMTLCQWTSAVCRARPFFIPRIY